MEHPTGLLRISNEAYHSGPGISKSHLDDIAPELGMTPKHYWHRHINPDYVRPEETDATRLGTAIHTALLEPDDLGKTVIRGLDLQRRSTADKYAWAEFEQKNQGKLILKAQDFDRVVQIRDAIMRHPFVGPLIRRGKSEQSFYTIDRETGLLVKCRPDYMDDAGEFILDVKSTESASTAAFGKSIANYRYDVQPPWYEDILTNLYGERPKYWIFLAIEKDAPFCCNPIYATDDMRRIGREKARRDLDLIAHCQATGQWPDFATGFNRAEMPGWYTRAAA